MGTPQHPGFKIKTHFLGEKKAPAGMGTPQHPGFILNLVLFQTWFYFFNRIFILKPNFYNILAARGGLSGVF